MGMVPILTIGLIVGSVLLWEFLKRFVGETARGAVDVAVGQRLAEHEHVLAKQLEEHRSAYGLFAENKHRVYAECYGNFEKARGMFLNHFGSFQQHPDFSRSREGELAQLAQTLEHISPDERRELHAATAGDLAHARSLATILTQRDSVRRAKEGFQTYQNHRVLNALYFSPEVEALVQETVDILSVVSVYADDLIRVGSLDGQSVKMARDEVMKLNPMRTRLRDAMRAELAPPRSSS